MDFSSLSEPWHIIPDIQWKQQMKGMKAEVEA